ncbi:hypothetical protein BURMUCF2_B0477 [Burkholderia multivorans CF2]|nr:hypothetical protein BURMUCF2_B0477 [Burkholderia multivorans CF2]
MRRRLRANRRLGRLAAATPTAAREAGGSSASARHATSAPTIPQTK